MTWDYEQTQYNKQAKADPVRHLERLINYGLDGQKIDRKMLEKYLPQLNIPKNRREFLELILWDKPF